MYKRISNTHAECMPTKEWELQGERGLDELVGGAYRWLGRGEYR